MNLQRILIALLFAVFGSPVFCQKTSSSTKLEDTFHLKCQEMSAQMLNEYYDKNDAVDLCNCIWNEMQVIFTQKELVYLAETDLMAIEEKNPMFIDAIQKCAGSIVVNKMTQQPNPDDALQFSAMGVRTIKSQTKDELIFSVSFCDRMLEGALKDVPRTPIETNAYCHSVIDQVHGTDFDFMRNDQFSQSDINKLVRIYQNASLLAFHGDSAWISGNEMIQGKLKSQVVTISEPNKTIDVKIGTQFHPMKIDLINFETLIDEDLEKELQGLLILNALNYFGEVEYELSVSKTINCRMYELPSLRIGEFVIRGVPILVVPNTQLTIGKAAFRRFSEYEKDGDQLILRR